MTDINWDQLDIRYESGLKVSELHPEWCGDLGIYDARYAWAAVISSGCEDPLCEQAVRNLGNFLNRSLSIIGDRDVDTSKKMMYSLLEQSSIDINIGFPGCMVSCLALKIFSFQGETFLTSSSVGNCRLYLYRKGILLQISQDDVMVPLETLPALGEASKKEDLDDFQMKCFGMRHMLSQSLGQKNNPQIHVYSFMVHTDDFLLLTSDGVHDNLTTYEIEQIINSKGHVADNIIKSSYQRSLEGSFRSNPDDICALTINIKADSP